MKRCHLFAALPATVLLCQQAGAGVTPRVLAYQGQTLANCPSSGSPLSVPAAATQPFALPMIGANGNFVACNILTNPRTDSALPLLTKYGTLTRFARDVSGTWLAEPAVETGTASACFFRQMCAFPIREVFSYTQDLAMGIADNGRLLAGARSTFADENGTAGGVGVIEYINGQFSVIAANCIGDPLPTASYFGFNGFSTTTAGRMVAFQRGLPGTSGAIEARPKFTGDSTSVVLSDGDLLKSLSGATLMPPPWKIAYEGPLATNDDGSVGFLGNSTDPLTPFSFRAFSWLGGAPSALRTNTVVALAGTPLLPNQPSGPFPYSFSEQWDSVDAGGRYLFSLPLLEAVTAQDPTAKSICVFDPATGLTVVLHDSSQLPAATFIPGFLFGYENVRLSSSTDRTRIFLNSAQLDINADPVLLGVDVVDQSRVPRLRRGAWLPGPSAAGVDGFVEVDAWKLIAANSEGETLVSVGSSMYVLGDSYRIRLVGAGDRIALAGDEFLRVVTPSVLDGGVERTGGNSLSDGRPTPLANTARATMIVTGVRELRVSDPTKPSGFSYETLSESESALIVVDFVRPCNPADVANTDGDFGPDGVVDSGDFQLFFVAFFATDPGVQSIADIADTDGNLVSDFAVDNADFTAFFAAFFDAACE